MDECADVEGEEHEGCGAVEKSICGWDRKWGVFRCTTLGAGVGLAG